MSEGTTVGDLPANVENQGKAADELHRKLYPDQYPESEKKEEPEKPGEEKPKEEVKAQEAQEPTRETPKPEEFRDKYETLRGKYDAEVPPLHMTVASLQNLVRELQGKITSLESAPKETPKEPEKPEEDDPVIKTFREEYPDIYSAVEKIVSAKAPAKVSEPPKEKPAAEAAPNPRATFDYYLNRDIPDWRDVNKDPDFVASLGARDPRMPGYSKLQLIQAAYDAADFTTVSGYFRDFKESKAKAPKPNEPTPEEKRLAPSTGSRASGTPAQNSPVSAETLKKFYNEARQGLWGQISGEKFRTEEKRLLNALTKPPT